MRKLVLLIILLTLLMGGNLINAQDGIQTDTPAEVEASEGLIVAQVLPAPDATDIGTDEDITIIFNRPIVPLTIAENMADLPSPIAQIEPPVTGEGEWLNTSIYVFHAQLAGGTTYTVTVDSVTAADGTTLDAPFTWSFTTQLPDVIEVFPQDGDSGVLLNGSLQVRFNQPVDPASAEAAFFLRNPRTDEPVTGTFEWADDSAGFRFTPQDDLALGTVYEAGFAANAVVSLNGGAPMERGTTWTFETVPFPEIISTSPADGDQNTYPWGGFTIYFASPMDVESLEDKITIEPEPWREYDSYYSEWDNSYSLSFPTEPSTEYTITIAPGMQDIYGNEINEGQVVTYTTAPFDPTVSLQTPGGFGFYNAYNEQTQLFLTHTNVSEINLDLYRVDPASLMFLGYGVIDSPEASADLLRQWTIPSVAPENARRYELLSLGDTSIDCPGAPESRLQVGDVAVVIATDAVRARESAPDGEVLTLLYQDYRLPIVGGPVCANEIVWWQVRLRDERLAWVAEGITGEYFIDLADAAERTPVAVTDEDGDALPPGVYRLRATAPELPPGGYYGNDHILIVGTVNITLKQEIDGVLAWVTNVNTGEPVAGAPLTVYNQNGERVGDGTTDADGIARIAVPRQNDLYSEVRVLLADGTNFGVAFSSWSDGIEGWYFNLPTDYFSAQYRAYMYTDRPLYRPNQPVYFRGIVRARDDMRYTPVDLGLMEVVIEDPEGQFVTTMMVEVTPFGTFSGQFDLAADAALGYYRVFVPLPDTEQWWDSGNSVTFGVAEYRLPEFQVNVTPEQAEVVQGDTIRVTVDSRYFFGGVVSNANVEYNVVSSPYYFNAEVGDRYSFIDYDPDGGASEFYGVGGGLITSGEGVTDANGQLVIEIPAELEDATQSFTYTIEATVTDESAQAVSGRTDVIVHKGLIYVGVTPEEYVGLEGDVSTFNLIAVDWEGEPIANQTINVEVVERRWSSVQEQDEFGRTTWSYEVEEIPISAGEVLTDEDGEAQFTFTPPNGGIFKLKASTIDANGNEVISADTIWIASRQYVSWRQQNSNRIDLIADRDSYEVGDTAQILITSPFQGTTEALITVERGGVLTAERITLESNSYLYELPITDEFAPNIFLSVVLVKGVDETNPVAAFRMGLIQLAVDNERKEITIEITPDVEQAGPGDTVTYTVRTTDYAGTPVSAEVGVGLTDLASLSIADPNSPPILGHFYGQQGLGVRTATPLTINVDQITQTVLDTIKGGGGGFGEGGIFDIREDFVDTAYWNAHIVTDENGTATFSVTLPDNLTTWRLDARALTLGDDGNMLVGQDTFDLLSTKPLLIRPVTPRFFVVGDQTTLGAVINNNTDEDLTVDVNLTSNTITDLSGAQQITIPAGQRARVNWDITIPDVTQVDFTFSAVDSAGQYADASIPPLAQDGWLPVYRYEVPETVGTAGMLDAEGSRTEQIQLPEQFEVNEAYLDVQVDASLAATTIDGLEYLENFPHQCVEQTVSRFLPNIMTYRALTAFGLEDPMLRAGLLTNVNYGIQQLYAFQKSDGGWGWFVTSPSNQLTTAYALIGLYEAQQQGFPVDDGVIRRAQSYLRSTFITPGLSVESWRLNRQAFVLYALARTGAPDIARTTTLYESRDRLALYAQAYLLMTLDLINPDDARINTLVSGLYSAAILSATGAHWDEAVNDYWNWNTDTRSTAIILQALIQVDAGNDLLPNVVRYLVTQRTADAWETTQETAWAVMALTDWMVTTGELEPNYGFEVALNGEMQISEQVTDPRSQWQLIAGVADGAADAVLQTANELVISRTAGEGALYYTAHLRVFLPVPEVEPLDRGIIVDRRYTLDGEAVTSANIGDTVQVRLTIIVPNAVHYVVIEDPIPAGTDAVDPNLSTSQQIGTQPEVSADGNPLAYGWGWWYFNHTEFRDEKVVLYADYLPAGTYEYTYSIRAGLAGEYNVIPPTAYEFYFPEVYGRGAGSLFTIGEGE